MNRVRRHTSVSVPADWPPGLVLEYATERIRTAENRRSRRVLHTELDAHAPDEDHPGHHRWRVSYVSAPATLPDTHARPDTPRPA